MDINSLLPDDLIRILNGITDGTADPALLINSDFRVAHINQAAIDHLGLSVSETVGCFCFDIVQAERLSGEQVCSANCPIFSSSRAGNGSVGLTINRKANHLGKSSQGRSDSCCFSLASISVAGIGHPAEPGRARGVLIHIFSQTAAMIEQPAEALSIPEPEPILGKATPRRGPKKTLSSFDRQSGPDFASQVGKSLGEEMRLQNLALLVLESVRRYSSTAPLATPGQATTRSEERGEKDNIVVEEQSREKSEPGSRIGVGEVSGREPEDQPMDRLTRREREILSKLARGKTIDEIAVCLNISSATVRGHTQHILDKLGVHSRVQAVVYAIQRGLIFQ